MYQRNRINGFLGAGVVILGLVLAACGLSSSPSATANPTRGFDTSDTSAEPPPGPLVFDGTFNGPAGSPPNPAQWTPKIGTPNGCAEDEAKRCIGPKELQYYTDNQNTALDGQGDLVITAKRQVTPAGRDSNGNVDPKFSCYLSDCQYTSARLSTKSPTGGYLFTAQGARFEARIKLAEGVGAWSAFWLLGANPKTWPAQGEIDIAESQGGNAGTPVSSVVHGAAKDSLKKFSCCGAPPAATNLASNFYSEFHTYTVDQTATTLTFYIDGKLWWQAKSSQFPEGEWIYDQPWYMVLNLAVGDYGGTPPSTGGFPKQMIVNWVKVYKLS